MLYRRKICLTEIILSSNNKIGLHQRKETLFEKGLLTTTYLEPLASFTLNWDIMDINSFHTDAFWHICWWLLKTLCGKRRNWSWRAISQFGARVNYLQFFISENHYDQFFPFAILSNAKFVCCRSFKRNLFI